MVELFTVQIPAEAYKRLEMLIKPLRTTESMSVETSLGGVLSEDIYSPENIPSFPRSVMDGFAVRALDTFGASDGLPALLNVVGEVRIGTQPDIRICQKQAVRISTGAMIPNGADAVVMVEYTQEIDPSNIEVLRPVATGENIITIGEDISKGNLILKKGTKITPREIAVLVSTGVTNVSVVLPPKVCIFSTGDELVAPHTSLLPGKIRDINSYMLAAMASEAGAEPVSMGIVKDELSEILSKAKDALQKADILVISAGSSVSARDMTSVVIESLGEPGIIAHGVALKPGKPTILAVANGKAVFGLPGNPFSAMLTFKLFVTPLIKYLLGEITKKNYVRAVLSQNIPSATGREEYVPVRLQWSDKGVIAVPIFGKSNFVGVLAHADGLAKVPLNMTGLSAGEEVEVELW